ncbi:hypothetical protein AB0D46_37750 [Streptomyces sp. NPDC048383]|uniref:hypothetical protein n=1 Tax=Streptomyces sp. NPDC048383 TaxID=3155386 RepID=UPI003422FA71
MNHESDVIAAVRVLWDEHRPASFPRGLAGQDRAGFDLVLVDADIAGCVHTWLDNAGVLDVRLFRVLHWRGSQLTAILTELGEADSPEYWHRLSRMARLVASTDSRPRDAYPPETWKPVKLVQLPQE